MCLLQYFVHFHLHCAALLGNKTSIGLACCIWIQSRELLRVFPKSKGVCYFLPAEVLSNSEIFCLWIKIALWWQGCVQPFSPGLKKDSTWQEPAGVNEVMCKHRWYLLLCSCAMWLFLMYLLALYAYNCATTTCKDLLFVVVLLHFSVSGDEFFLCAPHCESRSYFQRMTF